ncbi:beta subunit of fatty acid synthetase [Emydomyces testavorans]|uniref:Beta subunit of fatty acid synthetase n=1 Tax=Emydomyces testavorans TaxID=2070801 RepID=A0AAF0IHI9_9EURO|nr:beta subunit of fatty acid synthetase [Emydomyces testavorans]
MAIESEIQRKLFASPVRWIETQDAILSSETCERIIEIAPSSILKGMFKRTIDTSYKTQEYTLLSPRQLLSSETDTKNIYYEHEAVALQHEAPIGAHFIKIVEPSQPSPGSPTVEEIDDQAVRAQDLVIAIASRALKKSASEIDIMKSIKGLAGG